jgi:hypothetical protein
MQRRDDLLRVRLEHVGKILGLQSMPLFPPPPGVHPVADR